MKLLRRVWNFIYNHKLMLALLCIVGLLWYIHNLSNNNEYLKAKIVQENTRFDTWQDKLGREHALIKERTVYISQLDESTKAKLDSTVRLLGIRSSQVHRLTQVKTETKQSFVTQIRSDSFTFDNSFFHVAGKIDTAKVLHEDIVYSDVGTITSYTKPKKFLGIKYSSDDYVDISFNNKDTHIIGLTDVSLKPFTRSKKWGMGAQVGVMWNGQFKPYIGVGLSYNLINF